MRASAPLSHERKNTPAAASPYPRPSAERFRLDGPTRRLDPRTNAVRADVADVALAGILFAPHYARPVSRACIVPRVTMRSAPDQAAQAVSEMLLGEAFAVVDLSGGWAWGYSVHDHYVGYVLADTLGHAPEPDLIVTARHALVFAEANIKAPVIAAWPMGTRFAATREGAFWRTDAGFVHARHAAPLDAPAADPVAIAETLLGTPYRWGGRCGDGIDCSGLVQVALGLCGIAAPRDSDQQCAALGVALDAGVAAARGDIVFFPGHVGFMADAARLIHANAHAMAVTIEPLADVIARLAPDHAEPVLARRRIVA